jgi:hypothetical protein
MSVNIVSAFPGRPKLFRGALAVYPDMDPGTAASRVIEFQFNPEQLRRQLAHRITPPPKESGNTGSAREDVLRVTGPPVETISLTIVLDASDKLEKPAANTAVAENGLHPALATLELLMYPPSLAAKKIQEQAAKGAVQVGEASAPLVLLIWGKSRVVPVKLTSFSVTEEQYDTQLNPIAAKIDLGLQVLTYVEFPDDSVGREAFITYQQRKESLAKLDGNIVADPHDRYKDVRL